MIKPVLTMLWKKPHFWRRVYVSLSQNSNFFCTKKAGKHLSPEKSPFTFCVSTVFCSHFLASKNFLTFLKKVQIWFSYAKREFYKHENAPTFKRNF